MASLPEDKKRRKNLLVKRKKQLTMASLPEDIIIYILSMLPVKSIHRFKSVCKLWYALFKNPKFIKMHLLHATENNKLIVLLESYTDNSYSHIDAYYFIDYDAASSSYHMSVQTDLIPPDTFELACLIMDSCDGIIGLSVDYRNELIICLWNPSTREYKNMSLPTSVCNKHYKPNTDMCQYGVCYDWKVDDYKFLLIETKEYKDISSEVWVRRLGSNSWNNIGNIPYNLCHIDSPLKPLNGIFHWIGNTKVIVSFDIVEERTKEIQTPSCYLDDDSYSYEYMGVHVLGKDLYLSVNATHKNKNMDLWVMKDYGVIDSWTRIFSLSKDETKFDSLWPLQYLNKNGEILLRGYVECEDGTAGNVLVSYDPKNGSLLPLDIPFLPKHFYVTPFVGSLVSLGSGKFRKNYRKARCGLNSKSYKRSQVDTRHGA